MDHRPHSPIYLLWLLWVLPAAACSPAIDLPRPDQLKVQQLSSTAPQVELSWKLIVRVDGYLLHYARGQAGATFGGTGLAVVPWPEGCGDLEAGVAKGSDAVTPISMDAGSGDAPGTDAGADATTVDAATPDQGTPDQGTPDQGPADSGPADQSLPDKGPGAPDAGSADATGVDRGEASEGTPSPITIPASWCLDREDTFTDAGKVPVHTPGTRPRVRLQNLVVGQTYHFAVQAFRRAGKSLLSQTVSVTIKDNE